MTLADRIEAVLLERGPLPAGTLATELRKRRADVFAALHADPRFDQLGKRRASRWSVVAGRSFDVREAAARWGCGVKTAEAFLFGAEGFLELGMVESENGNGRLRVTERGRTASEAWVELGRR